MKNFVKFCLCSFLIMATLLCGCKNSSTTSKTESESVSSKATSADQPAYTEPAFTLEEVRAANGITALLENYRSIRLTENSGDSIDTSYFFRNNGSLAFVKRWKDSTDEYYTGLYKGISIEYSGEGNIKGAAYVDNLMANDQLFTMDNALSSVFSEGNIINFTQKNGRYTFEIDTDTAGYKSVKYTVFEKDLSLESVFFYNKDGSMYSNIYAYDEKIDDFDLIDIWDNTRKVSFECDYEYDIGNVKKSFSVEVPSTMEFMPYFSNGEQVFMDKDYTTAYAYPGEGDYTLYVTNKDLTTKG